MDLGDDQELDFIALLSSVGDDISIEDSNRQDTSIEDLSRQDIFVRDTTNQVCSVQDMCNGSGETVMTDVMSLVLPGQVVTVRTTEAISTLVQTGFEQLAATNVETGKQVFG